MSEKLKKEAASKALDYVQPGSIIGVGSGSTVNCFIEALGLSGINIEGAVCSSEETERRLRSHSIPVLSLNDVEIISVYIDGADQIDQNFVMIKGGGAALTREKIIASASNQYICIVDESKLVNNLSDYPVPIEVIPMAREHVMRVLLKTFGAKPVWREGVITDNGNIIIDVSSLDLTDALMMEIRLNSVAGIVENGIFAFCPADVLIVGRKEGVEIKPYTSHSIDFK